LTIEMINLRRLGGCKPMPAIDRFHASYLPEPNSGCWLWLGTERGSNGYGAIKVDGSLIQAHRYSWQLHKGQIPAGSLVCHSCDVPACVNPNHLFLGDHQANSDDKYRKGRALTGSDLSSLRLRTGARGDRIGVSKLTAPQVLSIRADQRPQREIAAEFGVSQTAINNIRLRKVWRHI
jgi:hypothetical protein